MINTYLLEVGIFIFHIQAIITFIFIFVINFKIMKCDEI